MPLRTTIDSNDGHSAAAPRIEVAASSVTARARSVPARACGSHTATWTTTWGSNRVTVSTVRWTEYVDACSTSVQSGAGSNFVQPNDAGWQHLHEDISTSAITTHIQFQVRTLNQDGNVFNDYTFTVVYDDFYFGVGLPVELETFEID